jgi:hypothetical protein
MIIGSRPDQRYAWRIDSHLEEFDLLKNLLELPAKQDAGPYRYTGALDRPLVLTQQARTSTLLTLFSSEGMRLGFMTVQTQTWL